MNKPAPCPPALHPQLPIGRYIVDFACRQAMVGVELDGSQHVDAVAYDEPRARFLEGLGWQMLRFWNSDVRNNPDGVAEAIVSAVDTRPRRTHPQPLPFREGS